MKVFLSWSKDMSRSVATAFASWLPGVIQECADPFISTETTKGDPWFATITDEMKMAKVGIVFITQENAVEPWVNFESGALFANFGKQRLCPVLIGVKKSDYTGPLKNLQLTELESKPDALDLLRTINKSCEHPLSDDVLSRTFELQWDALQLAMQEAVKGGPTVSSVKKRSTDEKVDELLEMVRELSNPGPLKNLRHKRSTGGSMGDGSWIPSTAKIDGTPQSILVLWNVELMSPTSYDDFNGLSKHERLKWFLSECGGPYLLSSSSAWIGEILDVTVRSPSECLLAVSVDRYPTDAESANWALSDVPF